MLEFIKELLSDAGVLQVLLGGGGLLGVIGFISNLRSSKRLKAAEASDAEIKSINLIVESLKSQIDYLNEEMAKLRANVANRDLIIEELYRNQSINAIKYAQKKGAIAEAYSCSKQYDCPVLIKQKEYDLNNLNNELLKRTKKDAENKIDKSGK